MFELRFKYSSIWPKLYQDDLAWELENKPKVEINVHDCSNLGEVSQLNPAYLDN